MRTIEAMGIAVAAFLGTAGLAHGGEAPAPKPARVEAKLVTLTADVQAIDYEKRTVTLQGPRRTVTLKVGPQARNFDQVKVGDKVKVNFVDAVAIFVRKPEGAPSAQEADVVEVAARGAKPGVVAVNTRQLTATVVGINYKGRTVDLKGPDGVTVRLPVDKNVQGFNDVKKGDQVVVRHTEAVAIEVSKP